MFLTVKVVKRTILLDITPCSPLKALYPRKIALTSPTSGGRSVGIVRSRTKTTEFSLVRWKSTDVSEGHIASIFGVEE
jgi:hypothetical protein